MDQLRLLFISHSFPLEDDPLSNVGGMQRVAYDLSNALSQHPNINLQKLILRTSWQATVFKMPAYFARAYRYIGRLIENREIDAVLFSSMVTASLLPFMKQRFKTHGILALSVVHGLDVTWPYALYQKHIHTVLGLLDGIFPVSRHTRIECLNRGTSPHKLFTTPNGIDPNRFNHYKNTTDMRHALCAALGLPLPDNATLLCSLGRLVPRKGFAWFVDRVMPDLPDHIHYWIGGHGPESETIQSAIDRQMLHHRVRLLGLVDEQHLELLFRGADLFIMPNIPQENDVEGFGVVMLEAGICGLPAIASNLEGIRDVITQNINGFLVNSQDADAFKQSILSYHPTDFMRQHVISHTRKFEWAAIANRIVQTIHRLHTARPAIAI